MALRPHLTLPELALRYLRKDPHNLDPEERKVLETFKERAPISRDAADIAFLTAYREIEVVEQVVRVEKA